MAVGKPNTNKLAVQMGIDPDSSMLAFDLSSLISF